MRVRAPDVVWTGLDRWLPSATAGTGSPTDLDYEITGGPAEGYALERDGAGVRRGLDVDEVVRATIADLAEIAGRRRPGSVTARAGIVALGDRAVAVVGPRGSGVSRLVSALERSGGTVYADGLARLDADARAHAVTGDLDGAAARPPQPVVLVARTSFAAGASWDPIQRTGARAALGLLEVVHPSTPGPSVRAMARHLADQVVELRGARPEAAQVAEDVIRRARSLPLPGRMADGVPAGDPSPSQPRGPSEPRPAPHVRFDDVLDEDEHARVVAFALAQQSALEPSGVTPANQAEGGSYEDLRRSQSAYDLDEIWGLFDDRMRALLPVVRRELGLQWFPLGHFERQLTVHGDGDHFTMHVDNQGDAVSSRRISAIYYFSCRPGAFSGGELRLYDTVERGGVIEAASGHAEITPTDNTLVLFRSDAHHEVRPVRVVGTEFADGRFSIVIWAHEASEGP